PQGLDRPSPAGEAAGGMTAADTEAPLRPGVTEQEAQRLLREEGPNELPSTRERPIWRIAAEVAGEPMFLLLVVGGAIYIALGDLYEALILLASVAVVMAITVYQERKTERALEALRDLSS